MVTGKGQFFCGNRRCEHRKKLRTWEVNFGYVEHGVKKNALIKCRLCFDCSYKLNYHHKKKELTKKKSKKRKHKRDRSSLDSDCSDGKSEKRKKKDQKLKEETEEKEKEKLEKQEKDVWSAPVQKEEEKTRDDEFDDFLDDLFL